MEPVKPDHPLFKPKPPSTPDASTVANILTTQSKISQLQKLIETLKVMQEQQQLNTLASSKLDKAQTELIKEQKTLSDQMKQLPTTTQKFSKNINDFLAKNQSLDKYSKYELNRYLDQAKNLSEPPTESELAELAASMKSFDALQNFLATEGPQSPKVPDVEKTTQDTIEKTIDQALANPAFRSQVAGPLIKGLLKNLKLIEKAKGPTDSEKKALKTLSEKLGKMGDPPTEEELKSLKGMAKEINVVARSLQSPDDNQEYWQNLSDTFGVIQASAKQTPEALTSSAPPKMGATKAPSGLGAARAGAGAVAQRHAKKQSLADAFLFALFGKFMPSQEASLADLADTLEFYNAASGLGNELLATILKAFANPGQTFDANTFFHLNGPDSKGHFTGNPDTAKANLAKEREFLKEALKKGGTLDKALKGMDDLIQKIKSGKPPFASLSPAHKNELVKMMNTYKGVLGTVRTQMTTLQTTLNKVTVTPIPPPPATATGFSLTGADGNPLDSDGAVKWLTELTKNEGLVVDGDTSQTDPLKRGGLGGLTTLIGNDQSHYSGLSQPTQIQLQAALTTMGQMWGVVSNSMQNLFQAYMRISQNLNAR